MAESFQSQEESKQELDGYPPWTILIPVLNGWLAKMSSTVSQFSRAVVFNHFGARNSFFGRHCFHQLGQRGWFQGDSSPFHLLCTFILLCQLHLRSLDPRGWGNPYSKERCSHLCTIQNTWGRTLYAIITDSLTSAVHDCYPWATYPGCVMGWPWWLRW